MSTSIISIGSILAQTMSTDFFKKIFHSPKGRQRLVGVKSMVPVFLFGIFDLRIFPNIQYLSLIVTKTLSIVF